MSNSGRVVLFWFLSVKIEHILSILAFFDAGPSMGFSGSIGTAIGSIIGMLIGIQTGTSILSGIFY